MSDNKPALSIDPFQAWSHRWGRFGTFIALVYMVALPFIVLGSFDAIPSFGEVINIGTISILCIYIPVGLSEAISYTPVLGSSCYLTFITGNIMNLKLPCAIQALQISETEQNSPAGDAVVSVAVAVSSIMTIIILAIFAGLSTQLSWLFELPAVNTASGYIIPALFGPLTLGLFGNASTGDKIVVGGIKGVIPVIVLTSVLAIVWRVAGIDKIMGTLYGYIGFVILLMLPIAIISSRIMWKKGIITVEDNKR